jgi:hypothetical protein
MKELHHNNGAFFVDDKVADSLERLAVALAENRMSAVVTLRPQSDAEPVQFTLGMDRDNGHHHVVRARQATGEHSHLGIDDF